MSDDLRAVLSSDGRVTFRSRESPDSDDEWDGNWLWLTARANDQDSVGLRDEENDACPSSCHVEPTLPGDR
jgi:hypothetical protein